ncbi:aldose epimerase family protein [Sphingobium aquiterrae]|uniref:aldose epimerase family protein n=1 Tax=Sphingobium aquiterrae TaxID=2038656 RepID=UPI003015F4AA
MNANMNANRTGLACAAVMLAMLPAAAMAATAQKAIFGKADDGRTVELVTLRNDKGMTVRFSTRGGTFVEIDAPDRTGKVGNVVLGMPDFAHWEKAGAFNSVVGRYANRISGGGFTLDGVFYTLRANPATGVAMHGGPKGFGSQIWQVSTFQRADAAGAVLTYVSVDGENGYPGELRVKMTYTLTNANVLRLDYEATTDKPTVINLTNHSYFNIGGDDSGSVYDQVMQVFASRWTPTDEHQVPRGEIVPVEGTPLDFRRPTPIRERVWSSDPQMLLAKGIDHNFVLDKPHENDLSVAVRLHDPKSGRTLEVRTTEPAVQIYTGNNLNGGMPGAGGRTLRQGDGVAFETEHFPDSPNKPNFPSTVLRPGQVFHSTTEFAFGTDGG